MKLSQKEKEMKDRINNYYLHEKDLQRYHERLFTIGDGEGSMTAKYGEEMMGSSNFKNSKVENIVITKMTIEEKKKEINKEMLIVDMTLKELNGDEYIIINYLKTGLNMSIISKILKLKRKKVERLRNSAIKKMVEFEIKNTF